MAAQTSDLRPNHLPAHLVQGLLDRAGQAVRRTRAYLRQAVLQQHYDPSYIGTTQAILANEAICELLFTAHGAPGA